MEVQHSKFGLAFDQSLMSHDARGLPEKPERIQVIGTEFRNAQLFDRSHPIHFVDADDLEQKEATLAWAAQNHSEDYLKLLATAHQNGIRRLHSDPDTPVGEHTFDCTWRSTHAVLAAVEKVMQGEITNAFCAVRPPGHHALWDKAMGFCYINHIAVAAQFLLQKYELSRIAMLDFDVHHGNGAQETLWNEERVLFSSIHGHPEEFWPGQGWEHERGVAGNILNIPLRRNTPRGIYRKVFLSEFIEQAEKLKPEFILVSAGFDAHEKDNFKFLKLVDEDYAWMAEQLTELANRHCQGRLVAILEGGYNLKVLGGSAVAFANVLERAANPR